MDLSQAVYVCIRQDDCAATLSCLYKSMSLFSLQFADSATGLSLKAKSDHYDMYAAAEQN